MKSKFSYAERQYFDQLSPSTLDEQDKGFDREQARLQHRAELAFRLEIVS